MSKNNITVLTVVPYEEPCQKEDDLFELLESAANLVSAVTDLTRNVKEIIEQNERCRSAQSLMSTPSRNNPCGSQKPEPRCLIHNSKNDVSVRYQYRYKDDTNVRAKGRVPAESSGAADSLKNAFEKKKWALKAKGIDVSRKIMTKKCSKEEATQSEVPFESKYVENATDKSKEEKPSSTSDCKNEQVKQITDLTLRNSANASSSESLWSHRKSPDNSDKDISTQETLNLVSQLPLRRNEQRATTSDDKRGHGRSKDRKDRNIVPITKKIKLTIRRSSAPQLK